MCCFFFLFFLSSFSFQRAACGCTGFAVLQNGNQQQQPTAAQVYFLFFSLCSCFICCSSFSFYFLNCSHNKQLLTQKQRRMKEITYSSQNVIRSSCKVSCDVRFDCKIPSRIMTAFFNELESTKKDNVKKIK